MCLSAKKININILLPYKGWPQKLQMTMKQVRNQALALLTRISSFKQAAIMWELFKYWEQKATENEPIAQTTNLTWWLECLSPRKMLIPQSCSRMSQNLGTLPLGCPVLSSWCPRPTPGHPSPFPQPLSHSHHHPLNLLLWCHLYRQTGKMHRSFLCDVTSTALSGMLVWYTRPLSVMS